MKQIYKKALFLIMTVTAISVLPGVAKANLSIIPTRVLFEDGERFEEIILLNTGETTQTYDITWEFFKMLEGDLDKTYDRVDESITDFDLTKYVVFTPRRVTLPPNGRQKIRLALRRPANVPPGEYRAHIRFTPTFEEKPEEQTERGQSAAINFRYTYSIPVVFQAGPLDAKAAVESFSFTRNEQNGRLESLVKINRSGLHGAQGHLFIYDGKGNTIGEISNAHIFPEVNYRKFKVPLASEDISGQTIVVEYRHYDKDKNIVFAKREFPIQ